MGPDAIYREMGITGPEEPRRRSGEVGPLAQAGWGSRVESDPVDRVLEDGKQLGLGRALGWLVVVLPGGSSRQGHEDTFDPGARGVQAELGATVEDEVELDVAASSDLLPLFLFVREGHVLAAGHERHVGGHKGIEARLDYAQDVAGRAVVEIVKEKPANASRLLAVLDVEVLVTPFLELGVEQRVVLVECVLVGLVEVAGVLLVQVRRRQIGPASEPPRPDLPRQRVRDLKVPVVGVCCRGMGVLWMKHQR